MYGHVCTMGNITKKLWLHLGVKPRERYLNSWLIFFIVHTCLYINEFIAKEPVRGVLTDCSQLPYFQLALTVPCPIASPPKTRWGSHEINAIGWHIWTGLSPTRSNSTLSKNLSSILTHLRTCYEPNCPCYMRDCPCYEHHTPVMSNLPLL